jgi:hypoxanthine phosphoribosyltransferase
MTPDADRLALLFDAPTLQQRVGELGKSIAEAYAGKSLVLLVVLRGSFMFAADLARAIDLPLRIEFMGVQSYGDATTSSGEVRITHDLSTRIEGEHVLVVEDIVDTGLTLDFLMQQLAARRPASLKLCALLHKPSRTVRPITIDFLGFTIEDLFVVGYGLDYAQRLRNLPGIHVLQP